MLAIAATATIASAALVENFDDWHAFEHAYIEQLYIDTVNQVEGAGCLAGLANTGSSGTFATTIQTSTDLNANAPGSAMTVSMYFSDVSAIKSNQISVWLYSGTPWSGDNIRWLLAGGQVGWNTWVAPFGDAFSTAGSFDTSDVANYQVQIYGNGTVAEYDYKIDALGIVPEPGSMAALSVGLVGLLGVLRRRVR